MPLVRDVAPAPDLGAPPQGVSLPTGKRGALILEPGPQQPPQIFSGGPVSDIFDVALAGQYAAAGVATGKGIRRGVLERTSYGELLPEEFRTTKLGRVTEFGMNVVGDPLTYTPMGWIGRGVKAIPGAKAVGGVMRTVAVKGGLARPTTIKAAQAVEGLAETKLAPLVEQLGTVRSEQTLARVDAALFSRQFRTALNETSRTPARGARQLGQAGQIAPTKGELLKASTEYFDLPGRHVASRLAQGLEPTAANLGQLKQEALAIRRQWLSTLPLSTRKFATEWGERVATQHEADLTRLVQLGLLTPERASLWSDVYLRNTYLRHLSPEQYAETLAKKDPMEAARILGEAERAAGRTGTLGGVPGRAAIQPRKAMTAKQQQELGLLDELDARYAVQRTLNSELIARGELNNQVGRLYALPESEVNRLATVVPNFERVFRQMPDDRRWGGLAGRWVPKEIHQELIARAWKPEGLERLWVKLIAGWKIGKVAMPGTIRRNLTSNFAQIHASFGAGALAGTLKHMPAAFDDVRTASTLYQRAIRAHPMFGSSQLDAEVGDLLRAATVPKSARHMGDKIVDAVSKVGRPFTTAYEYSELVPKMALFRDGLARGLSDKAAATRVVTSLFDYGDVPPVILAARRYGIYPFVTFPFKVVTDLIPAIAKRPGRLATQIKAIQAATDEPTKEELQALSPAMRSGAFVKLPMKDWKGLPIFYDLSYELFFGDIGEAGTPIGTVVAALQGNAPKTAAISTLLTPIGQVAAEIALNKSLFTGQPVAQPEEVKTAAGLRHVARAMLPGPVFAGLETAAQPGLSRMGLRPSSPLAKAVSGRPTAAGVQPPSVTSATLQTLAGIRTIGLDVPRSRASAVLGLKRDMGELERRAYSIARAQNLSNEEKRQALRRLKEEADRLVENVRGRP